MTTLADQHAFNVAPGPWHEPASALPEGPPTAPPPGASPVRAIAYHLPQFHRVAVNDAAWGAGFTEWNNVARALPRFPGHVQPRLPADLGFYDLSLKATIEAQAALARRAGLAGLCIHDYWFSGEKVLETPLRIILDNPGIELNFCLNWANENWTRRWDGLDHDIILAQKHAPGDAEAYLNSIAPALADPRYIRVDGRPLLMLYRPGSLPDAADTVRRWRDEARRLGLGELYVVMPQAFDDEDPRRHGMDAAAGFPPHGSGGPHPTRIDRRLLRHLDPAAQSATYSYEAMARNVAAKRGDGFRLLPGVCPSWDNEARKPGNGAIMLGANPARYGWWLRAAGRAAMEAPEGERVVFINAWNEWAEGAVLEPDRHYGHAWLAETRRALDDLAADPASGEGDPFPPDDRGPAAMRPALSGLNYVVNRARAAARRLGLGG